MQPLEQTNIHIGTPSFRSMKKMGKLFTWCAISETITQKHIVYSRGFESIRIRHIQLTMTRWTYTTPLMVGCKKCGNDAKKIRSFNNPVRVGCKKCAFGAKNIFVLFCIKTLIFKSTLNSRSAPFSSTLIPLFAENKGIREKLSRAHHVY